MRVLTFLCGMLGCMGAFPVITTEAASTPRIPIVPIPATDVVWGDDVPAGPPAMPSRRKTATEKPKVAAEGEEMPYLEKMAMHRKLKADSAGVRYELGHWSYGDYKHNVDAGSVKDCALLCDDDKQCMHWQFQLEQDRCDHKTFGGRMAAGDVDWVIGHSKHYVPEKKLEL